MRALDTNVLVYAHREETTRHEAAAGVLTAIAEEMRPGRCPSSYWPSSYAS